MAEHPYYQGYARIVHDDVPCRLAAFAKDHDCEMWGDMKGRLPWDAYAQTIVRGRPQRGKAR